MKIRLGNVGLRRIVLGAIVGVAAVLFIASMFTPFLDGVLYGAPGSHVFLTGEAWSFRTSFKMFYWNWILPNGSYGVTSNVSTGERWFIDYWAFNVMPQYVTRRSGLFYWAEYTVSISLVIFIDQIATLLFIALSPLIRRFQQWWLLGAAVCGLLTILNMWAFSQEVSSVNSFETGFWLAIASDTFLFAAFATSYCLFNRHF
jgi:hypothetical protein